MGISRAEVVDYLANMTVLELSTLIKELEEKFGVSAAVPMAMAAAGPMAAEAAPAVEEQTEFDVVLTEDDVAGLRERARFGVAAQTTQPIDRVRRLVAAYRYDDAYGQRDP